MPDFRMRMATTDVCTASACNWLLDTPSIGKGAEHTAVAGDVVTVVSVLNMDSPKSIGSTGGEGTGAVCAREQ